MGQPSLLSEIGLTYLRKTCILEMLSEFFYENFNLKIVSIELVQFWPLSLRDGGRRRRSGGRAERARGQNWTSLELSSLRFRPFHSGSFLGSAHDSCHICSFAMCLRHDDTT